ncbi:hypothetical protein NC652_015381 [Populus alba x Populus x berolinensis]|nr:hypothetical protein NC652_015381 [Populus alba x Populus x berolinensis]
MKGVHFVDPESNLIGLTITHLRPISGTEPLYIWLLLGNLPLDMKHEMEMELETNSSKVGNGKGKEEEEEEKEDSKRRKLGGIKTMPFILSNEICDKFAAAGFHANMITYLTQQLNLPLVKASNTLTNFGGMGSFTPLIGALIADSYAGRYGTIIGGSIIYELGMISLTVSAVLPSLRPPPCPSQVSCKEASNSQLWILYMSLILTSIGSGGIKPCVVTFAADQFDMTKSAVGSRSWNFFNWYYFCMGMATLTALTVVVYIQDNVGWGWGLGIPAIGMALSIVAFIFGSSLYNKLKPEGSPLVRLAQVVVAAAKKRKEVMPLDPGMLYQNKELDAAISVNGRLLHSDQFRWFDKAAIVTNEDEKDSKSPNLWRIATVHRIEELKCIVRMLPIWSAGILLVTASSHLHSFVIQQARSMDRHLSHSFEIPPASFSIFSILTMLIGLVLYERLFVPFARRFTGNPSGITCLQRMGVGFLINIIATIVSALVEVKRKQVAALHNLLDAPQAIIPISVFWLLPQYILHGIADVFMSVGHMEFLYDQSPETMRSTAAALNSLEVSMGNYIGTLVVSLVHKYTGQKNNWLPDRNLNRGKLDYYYWLVTGIQVINLVYYVICAWFYTYKPLEEVKEEDDDVPAQDEIQHKRLNYAEGNGEVELRRKVMDNNKADEENQEDIRSTTEIFDRFSTIGFHANMITYLTQQLNLPLVRASNIVSNFDGTSSLTPLIGALIADSFAGPFWAIAVGSTIFELGLISFTTTALLKSLHPPPCPTLVDCKEASSFQLSIFYLSLLLLAIGLGGTRPCVMTYAADQLDMSKSSVESRSWNFFNWYYFSLGVARLTAVSVVVYIQDNVSWGWGLGIPTIAMGIAFIVFLAGSPLYKKVKPGGSPLVRVTQVIVSAIRKRKAVAPEDSSLLYQNKELDAAISVHGRLLHTPQFKWLDKAAVMKDGEATDSNPPNPWKIATVHRVEELKSFLRLLPVWAAGILLVTANSHSGSFNTQQAWTMKRHLSNSFQIPPASIFTGTPAGITHLQRMGIGLIFNILTSIVSALVEKKRRTVAEHHNLLDNPKATVPISVFWLVPQLSLHGISEIFMTEVTVECNNSCGGPQLTPEEERVLIRDIAITSENNSKEGDSFYLITQRWWQHWIDYVNQEQTNVTNDGSSMLENCDVVSSSRRPASIDNSDLIHDANSEESNVGFEIHDTLLEGRDYILLPQEVWNQLYGGGPALARKVISSGLSQTEYAVEVYPLRLRLFVMPKGDQSTIRISKKETIGELHKRACELFDLNLEQVCIWDYYGQHKHALMNDMDRTLDDANLQMDQDILVEVHNNANGTALSRFIRSAQGNGSTVKEASSFLLEPSKSSLSIAGGLSASKGVSRGGSTELSQSPNLTSQGRELDNTYGISTVTTRGSSGGLIGLQNLGNTCFMNSAIQCLVHTSEFAKYFREDYHQEINWQNPLGMVGELALAFGELLRRLWAPGRTAIAPRQFKMKLARFAPQFSGYNQHDSQELLAFLLDGLHEDLNRVKHKPYKKSKDADGRPDEEVADEYWANHIARNDSIIVDVCQGQYKSTLVCPECHKISVTFDPFMYLSLPLQSTTTRSMTVTIFTCDGSALPFSCTVTVPKQGRCRDLINALSSACSLKNNEELKLAEVRNHLFQRFLEDPLISLSMIKDDDHLVAYKIPKSLKKTLLIRLIHRRQEQETGATQAAQHWKPFGTPLVSLISRDEVITRGDIQTVANTMLSSLLRSESLRQADTSEPCLSLAASEKCCDSSSGEACSNPMSDSVDKDSTAVTLFKLPLQLVEESNACVDLSVGEDKAIKLSLTSTSILVYVDWSQELLEKYDTHYLENLPEVCKYGPVNKKARTEPLSLYTCLEAFLREEPLVPEDMYCPKCKERRQASKKLDLWRLPEVLVIHLKRFSFSRSMKHKLETFVNFPIHDFDLTKYIANKNNTQRQLYELYALTNHYGGMGSGHYTAHIKLLDESRWYNFDDTHISPINEEDVKSAAAYVLFYRRVKTSDAISNGGKSGSGHNNCSSQNDAKNHSG